MRRKCVQETIRQTAEGEGKYVNNPAVEAVRPLLAQG